MHLSPIISTKHSNQLAIYVIKTTITEKSASLTFILLNINVLYLRMEKLKEIIITDSIHCIASECCKSYLTHALCLGGQCSFIFNGEPFIFKEGDLMIIRKGSLVENIVASEDFKVKNICISATFIELCTPPSNYGMKGQLALFLNPIMHLNPDQRFVCERDFRWIEYRLEQTSHKFYRELVINAVQSAILDFFDFHSTISGEDSISTQNASIMNRFLSMLEDGAYRRNREVSFYADSLCVTPKYLSEVSKRVSGYAANYWINRYTSLDIARMLRDKSLTFVQISDMFNFSSPAYFSRYVQRNLGMNPTQYRE